MELETKIGNKKIKDIGTQKINLYHEQLTYLSFSVHSTKVNSRCLRLIASFAKAVQKKLWYKAAYRKLHAFTKKWDMEIHCLQQRPSLDPFHLRFLSKYSVRKKQTFLHMARFGVWGDLQKAELDYYP